MFSVKKEAKQWRELDEYSLKRMAECISDSNVGELSWMDMDDFEQSLAYLDGVADTLPNPGRMKAINRNIYKALDFRYQLQNMIEWKDNA